MVKEIDSHGKIDCTCMQHGFNLSYFFIGILNAAHFNFDTLAHLYFCIVIV